MHITSWSPNFNGSHFGLPPTSLHGLPEVGDYDVFAQAYRNKEMGPGMCALRQCISISMAKKSHQSELTRCPQLHRGVKKKAEDKCRHMQSSISFLK